MAHTRDAQNMATLQNKGPDVIALLMDCSKSNTDANPRSPDVGMPLQRHDHSSAKNMPHQLKFFDETVTASKRALSCAMGL